MNHGSGHWDALLNNIQSRGHVSVRPQQKSDGWIKEDKRIQTAALGKKMEWRIEIQIVCVYSSVMQVILSASAASQPLSKVELSDRPIR